MLVNELKKAWANACFSGLIRVKWSIIILKVHSLMVMPMGLKVHGQCLMISRLPEKERRDVVAVNLVV